MPRPVPLHTPVIMAELKGAQSEYLKGGCPDLGIGKHFLSVLLEQRKTKQRIARPHLAFSLPVLFHSSKHSVSEHRVISLWIIIFGGCRQQCRTENKTVGGAAGAEKHRSSQPQTHLYPGEELLLPRSCAPNLLLSYTTSELCQLFVSTSRDERKLATNF